MDGRKEVEEDSLSRLLNRQKLQVSMPLRRRVWFLLFIRDWGPLSAVSSEELSHCWPPPAEESVSVRVQLHQLGRQQR